MMTEALLALALVLVATTVVYFKFPRFKKVCLGAAAAAVALVVGIVAVSEERKRRREARQRTGEVKGSRVDGVADSADTEKALNSDVAKEGDIHDGAQEEQDELKAGERTRLET